jgi:hypothetical protein
MTKGIHGSRQREDYPIRPAMMAAQCRVLAADLRRESAQGMAMVAMTGLGNTNISRLEAAQMMEMQAARWQAECDTGIANVIDRARMDPDWRSDASRP